MEHSNHQDNSEGSLTPLLMATAWLFNMAINYDNVFKVLTIVSLLLIIFVNIGKAIKMLNHGFIWVKEVLQLFKKK